MRLNMKLLNSKEREKRKKQREEIKNQKGIEELLKELREKNNWSYAELIQRIKRVNLSEKEVKKWEYGLKYPDLDMIYELSELYNVPSAEFIQAKNISFLKGTYLINTRLISWLCYLFNFSVVTAIVIVTLFYIFALIFAFSYFVTMASNVVK